MSFRKPLVILTIAYIAVFCKAIALCRLWGAFPTPDPDSVSNAFTAARFFVKNGILASWKKTALLSYYPDFEEYTPSLKVYQTRVYTHFYPGPDYLLALLFSIFGSGDRVLTWARLLPFSLLIGAASFLFWAVRKRIFPNWDWGVPAFAILLFSTPAIYYWGLCLYGEAYSSACVLFLLGIGIELSGAKPKDSRRLLAAAFGAGFLSQYFYLTTSFTVCAAPALGILLGSRREWQLKGAIRAGLFTGLGQTFAFSVHFIQVVAFLGGLHEALAEQFGTAAQRAGAGSDVSVLQLIGQFGDRTRVFFRFGYLELIPIGLFAAWARLKSVFERRKSAVLVAGATLASLLWIILMPIHSAANIHLTPVIFILQYAVVMLVILQLAQDIIMTRR